MRPSRRLRQLLTEPISTLTGLRLRTQYALVLLAVLLVLGTVVVGTTEFFQRQTIEQEERDLNETAVLAAEQIDENIESSMVFLRGQSTEFEPNLSNRDRVLNNTVNNSEFLLALVTDDTGKVLALDGDISNESIRNDTIGSDLSGVGYIDSALDNSTYIQRPSIEDDGSITLTMSAPIYLGNRQPKGVIVATVLIGSDGSVAGGGPAGTDYFRPLQPLDTSTQSAFVEQGTSNGTVQIRAVGESFDEAITRRATVDATGWTVRVERDRAALTDRLRILQYVQFGSLLVVLLLLLGLGFYQYRTNLRQTGQLLDGFGALAEGEFDHELGFSGAREWEEISDGFNTMAEGLREREQTIRKRERAIREREQRLSVLNRVLRHNMQNDLNVILGHAQLLAESDEPERRTRAANTIDKMARGLIDHSRKARRLETVMENAQSEFVALDIVSEVEEIVDRYRDGYPDFTVTLDAPERAPVSVVAGVEFGIESLIQNAFQHNDSDDPEVHVTVTRDDDYTHVEIRDNGPGIPQHERDVLGQTEETSLEHGSGIGLWLAYWATTKSRGTLRFEDPDEGGLVVVSLLNAETADGDQTGDDPTGE
jgi:signal transduction histidine kinase